ncbi:MAG: hypothetical protein ACYTFG_12355, partial [Planctomycetota bacterium]
MNHDRPLDPDDTPTIRPEGPRAPAGPDRARPGAKPGREGDESETIFTHNVQRGSDPVPPTLEDRAAVVEGATVAPKGPRPDSISGQIRSIGGIPPAGDGPDATGGLVRGPGAADRYSDHGEIARGGMGAILEVEDGDIRRPVAMKVILGDEDPEQIERFVAEAQVTGQL